MTDTSASTASSAKKSTSVSSSKNHSTPTQAEPKAPQPKTTAEKLTEFQAFHKQAQIPAGQEAVEKQHERGKNTARERIDMLVDPGSFVEFGSMAVHRNSSFGMEKKKFLGDGLVSGYGTIDGRQVAVYAQDFSVFGGSLSEINGEKIAKVQEFGLQNGCPVIGINDGGGARIQEGVASLAMFADIFRNNVHSSGVVPQISIIMGPAAGGAAYSPALTDFLVMVDKKSHMFITGPDVIKTVTGEDIDMESLGGANQHNSVTGTSHYLAHDEQDAIDYVKELLEYLPSNNASVAPEFEEDIDLSVNAADRKLNTIIPDEANHPYDMQEVIKTLVDDEYFFETQKLFAPNVLTGFARINGESVGIVANQPLQLAGTLDIAASEKAARFVRTCDAFGIPIITLVDVPGFLPGTEQEFNGIIRRGAKLLYAYAEATVPLITVITRKAYGGAYIVMGSKKLGADINLAWPTAQIGVMGAQGAVNILYRRHIAEAEDPEAYRQDATTAYEDEILTPYQSAELGYVDEIIMPEDTRMQIVKGLAALKEKHAQLPRKKHGNIPL